MSKGSGDGGYAAAKTADKIRSGEVDALIDGVLTNDKTVGDVLLAAERAGLDDNSSPLYGMLARKGSTDALRTARREGDVDSLNAATGLSERRIEATGYGLLMKAAKPAAQQILIKGPKGSGKTTKALDIARRLHSEFDGELSVATNIKGPDEHPDVTFVETISEMLEWVRDTPGEKLIIGDEWSSTLNAHAEGGGKVRQTFSRFINALRKGTGGSTRLIVIGHEHDTDIAAIIRNQSDIVIKADGKKADGLIDKATLYEGWSAYLEDDAWVRIRGLTDVPSGSAWGTSTNYFATFELDLDDPKRQIRRGKLIENWRDYQDAPEIDESDRTERVSCRGVKKDGDDCGALTSHESGFCAYHRDQWDGEADPRFEERE